MSINTNVHALGILKNYKSLNSEVESNITRLSTGLRINSAKDGAADLAISERFESRVRGIKQAIRNTQDGANMIKTAEASLKEVQDLLHKMRVKAVHASNTAVISSNESAADQKEIRDSLNAIKRIARTTEFGDRKLLDGTSGTSATITSPANISSIYVGSRFDGKVIQDGTITVTKTQAATKASITLDSAFNFASANAIVTQAGTFSINGHSFSTDGTETLQQIADKINQHSHVTGVTAQLDGAGPVDIKLIAKDYGSNFKINFAEGSGILHNAATTSAAGVNGQIRVEAMTDDGLATLTLDGGKGQNVSGLQFTDNDDNVFVVSENGNAGLGVATAVADVSQNSVRFQMGPDKDHGEKISLPNIFPANIGTTAISGKSLEDVDVSTEAGAQQALDIIDAALQQISEIRADLGSFDANFLQSSMRSMAVQHESLTASLSDIRDADIAEETTKRTGLLIKQQTSTAMLSQALQEPYNILQLLQAGGG